MMLPRAAARLCTVPSAHGGEIISSAHGEFSKSLNMKNWTQAFLKFLCSIKKVLEDYFESLFMRMGTSRREKLSPIR